MSDYIKNQAEKHKVKHTISGKYHFFEVLSGNSEEIWNVVIKVNCGCDFYTKEAIAHGKICSHILAVLNKIGRNGQINGGKQ